MKYLPHIILPPLLIALIAAVIYLPKHYEISSLFQAVTPAQRGIPESQIRADDEASFRKLIAPYIDALDSGDLTSAESEIAKIGPQITEEQKTGLLVALITAKDTQAKLTEAAQLSSQKARQQEDQFNKELAARDKAIAAAQKEAKRQAAAIESAEQRLIAIKKEQAAEIAEFRATLATLTTAAESAAEKYETSTEELLRLRHTIESRKSAPSQSDGTSTLFPTMALPAFLIPLKIPAPLTVHFRGDSTEIPDSVGMYVEQMGEWLSEDPRLGIKIEGRAQAGYSPEENEKLKQARLQIVMDTLTANGAEEEQIKTGPDETDEESEKETESEKDTADEKEADAEDETGTDKTEAVDKESTKEEEAPKEDPFGFVDLVFFER